MLKEIIDRLNDNDRRFLMYAHVNQLSQYVDLPGGKFIGVNVEHIRNLQIENKVGSWAYGNVITKKEKPGNE